MVRGSMAKETELRRRVEAQRIGAEIARRLRGKRLELGLSVDALAAAAGIGRAQVVRIERGEGGESSVTTIALLAEGLGVEAPWLAYGA